MVLGVYRKKGTRVSLLTVEPPVKIIIINMISTLKRATMDCPIGGFMFPHAHNNYVMISHFVISMAKRFFHIDPSYYSLTLHRHSEFSFFLLDIN